MPLLGKRWWHYEPPLKPFWFCYVLGAGPPMKKHWFRWQARREAVRLALQLGLPVYVLRSEAVYLPLHGRGVAQVEEISLYSQLPIGTFFHPEETRLDGTDDAALDVQMWLERSPA